MSYDIEIGKDLLEAIKLAGCNPADFKTDFSSDRWIYATGEYQSFPVRFGYNLTTFSVMFDGQRSYKGEELLPTLNTALYELGLFKEAHKAAEVIRLEYDQYRNREETYKYILDIPIFSDTSLWLHAGYVEKIENPDILDRNCSLTGMLHSSNAKILDLWRSTFINAENDNKASIGRLHASARFPHERWELLDTLVKQIKSGSIEMLVQREEANSSTSIYGGKSITKRFSYFTTLNPFDPEVRRVFKELT
jgi:hypothetical protein